MAVSLDDLRVFIAVATAGSFGRGAARLHMSQPAVSERMARLERDITRPLFRRGGRGVTLTAAGRRLLPYAQRCTALADEAIAAARAEDAREPLRVAMHASFATSIMPLILDALAPLEIGVTSTDAHTDEVITMLHDDTADFGIVVPWPHPPTITLERWRDDPVVCVAAPNHPLATRLQLHIRDLTPHLLAGNAWGDGAQDFLAQLRAAAMPSHRFHTISPPETVASLARRGSHVGVLTRSTVEHDLATGALVELPVADLPRWHVTLALAYRTKDTTTDHIRALRSTFTQP